MKRNRNLVLLSHDHYQGLNLANLIKKGAPVFNRLPNDVTGKLRYTLDMYDNDLVKHFSDEEEILFPAVEGKDPDVDIIIEEMLEDHSKVRDLIFYLRTGHSIEENLHQLGCLLEKHIRKEERVLFKRIEELLSAEELKILGMRICFSKNK
jgi:iron-sulfur cluster repair protein YtfE (RIC family)